MDNKKDKLIVKDDINFLEYPNWVVAEKEKVKEFTIEKENGMYKISTSSDTLPDRFDKIVLYYLLCKMLNGSQLNSLEIKTTRYKLAKDVFYRTKSVGKTEYNRIMLSLERWTSIFIKFDGVFYDGDNYTKRYFHVIEDVVLDEKKRELYIKFNEQYITQLRESNFCKFINFDEYKLLTRPVSARLYEILIKTFKDRDVWKIHIIKLAEKLTLEKRQGCDNYYPSDVIIKVKPAVNEITNKTDLKVGLDYDNHEQICTFTKIQKDQPDTQQQPSSVIIPEDDQFKSLTALLPTEHQEKKTILDVIANFHKTKGFDYSARNIKYTNQHCNGNYRVYLNKALQQDWGLAMQEDEERKQNIIKEQEYKKQQEQEELRQQIEQKRQVQEYIKTSSPENLETLRTEAISQLDEDTKKAGKLFGNLEMLIQFQIERIVLKKLKETTSG